MPRTPFAFRGTMAFVLLKPDVLLRRITHGVLTSFSKMGLQIAGWRIGRLTEPLFDEFYSSSFNPQFDWYEHNRAAFQYGPVIGLLLYSEEDDHRKCNLQRWITERKGAAIGSRPSETIRSIFGATDRVFNIMHSTIDELQAAREAEAWFGSTALCECISMCSRDVCVLNRIDKIIDEVNSHQYCCESSLLADQVLGYWALRLLHAIQSEVSLVREVHELRAPREAYNTASNWRNKGENRWHIRHEMVIDILDMFCKMCSRRTELSQFVIVIECLREFYESSSKRCRVFEIFCQQLAQLHVYVSGFEKYIVRTHLIYPIEAATHSTDRPSIGANSAR